MFVIARNSCFHYQGKAVDIKQVGRELGVRYVLEGSVRRINQRVRVTAQLVETVTGRHLWAEKYDRDLADIFEIQDEITRSVVGSHPNVKLSLAKGLWLNEARDRIFALGISPSAGGRKFTG